MLFFMKQIGFNCAILDSDDGAVDWITRDELDDYIKNGVEMTGVDAKTGELTPQTVNLHASRCNWDDGENIFKNVKTFSIARNNHRFTLTARGRRKYKGKLTESALEFNSGVRVSLPVGAAGLLMSDDIQVVFETLRGLVAESQK